MTFEELADIRLPTLLRFAGVRASLAQVQPVVPAGFRHVPAGTTRGRLPKRRNPGMLLVSRYNAIAGP